MEVGSSQCLRSPLATVSCEYTRSIKPCNKEELVFRHVDLTVPQRTGIQDGSWCCSGTRKMVSTAKRCPGESSKNQYSELVRLKMVEGIPAWIRFPRTIEKEELIHDDVPKLKCLRGR
ncbi:hypothetical protein Y032_0004g1774 [Ancylostoma ceylanicum]|uniref:Uncharacterized protein n=1 Tax=Ancylostoma ceylanicum TaxID=53326 RepID=A0A016VVJ8_9BILA|nr:hypothetical protein Y032_0004g1774 [Ancylostoma ceylanicum]